MIKALTSIKLFLILLIYLCHTWFLWSFFVDDSYITFRYVRQWTHGNGLVYNIGERVEGYSNFLWVIILALFDLSGVELVTASKLAGITLGILTIVITCQFARKISSDDIAPLFLAVSGPFVAWSVGGLETLLFSCILTVAILFFVKEEEAGRGWGSGIFFGLLSLIRPEGLMFALVAVAYRTWCLYHFKQTVEKRDVIRLVLLFGIVVPYFLWRFWYYGYWLPNTVYAKSMGLSLRPVLEGVIYLYQSFVAVGGFFFLAFPIALVFANAKRSFVVEFLAVNVGVYTIFIVVGGGDWMPMQRFLVHILPLVYLLVQQGLVNLRQAWQYRWAVPIILFLVLGQTGYLFTISMFENNFILSLQQALAVTSEEKQENPNISYIQQELALGETIAVVDAGEIPYGLPLDVKVIDMVGLTDEHIAHQPAQFPSGLLGRGDAFGKWDVDYVLALKPRFVQVHLIRQTEDGQWITNFTGTTLLVNDPRFLSLYRLNTSDGKSIFERVGFRN